MSSLALANLDLESAPWNARSIRSHFLRRFGVVVARGVGSSLVRAKWDGRVLLRARGLVARNHPTVRCNWLSSYYPRWDKADVVEAESLKRGDGET